MGADELALFGAMIVVFGLGVGLGACMTLQRQRRRSVVLEIVKKGAGPHLIKVMLDDPQTRSDAVSYKDLAPTLRLRKEANRPTKWSSV